MKKDNTFIDNHEGHIVVTYELLFLLQWLMDHEVEALKKIIARSLKNGLNPNQAAKPEALEMQFNDPIIQQSVGDFLGLLDILLTETITEISVQQTLERNLIPALNHIDASVCDDAVVQGSLKKANLRPGENVQDTLLKELLRRWKPEKKHIIN